ncbi:uncharacterized protein LOC110026811 [Phalaenopsis equestris]|uniref:uncharacterized protein LOC110026811 n=1 Tax=Phalaenopsis equestris TaxID=78828 RepID=UPI0009E572CA|nr:uncharacterized protein LOC110026811 [Phalaenopsis equestris]
MSLISEFQDPRNVPTSLAFFVFCKESDADAIALSHSIATAIPAPEPTVLSFNRREHARDLFLGCRNIRSIAAGEKRNKISCISPIRRKNGCLQHGDCEIDRWKFQPSNDVREKEWEEMRLFFWYLDPLLLKNDISEALLEVRQRPFLSLKSEFYNRPTWRRMILCFVTSPAMLRQASALLHSWFLISGLTFVLELHIALVSAVLDMVSRPMAWGVSMEMGLKYPFPHAYFPNNLQELLGVLNGPISCNSFVNLVHYIELEVICPEASFEPTICLLRHETMQGSIENNSTWSMLMKFPTWFYFASVLIFYHNDIQASYISEVISNEINLFSSYDRDLIEAAIIYLSFVLCPVVNGHGDRLAEHFLKLSRSWSVKSRAIPSYEQRSSLTTHSNTKVSLSLRRKLRINKSQDDKHAPTTQICSFSALSSWLRDFDDVCIESWTKPFLRYTSVDSKGQENTTKSSKKLFNKIPLGIFILYPTILSDRGCELLLYYATTGEILQHKENQTVTSDCHEHEITLCYGSDGRKWASEGVCLVFSYFDIVEEISVMLFDCEATRLDFICHQKGKVCKYLLRCVKILLNLCIQQLVEVRGRVGLLDLFRRLFQWKQQGREIFQGCEEFNDAVDGFAKKFLTLKELQEVI